MRGYLRNCEPEGVHETKEVSENIRRLRYKTLSGTR